MIAIALANLLQLIYCLIIQGSLSFLIFFITETLKQNEQTKRYNSSPDTRLKFEMSNSIPQTWFALTKMLQPPTNDNYNPHNQNNLIGSWCTVYTLQPIESSIRFLFINIFVFPSIKRRIKRLDGEDVIKYALWCFKWVLTASTATTYRSRHYSMISNEEPL